MYIMHVMINWLATDSIWRCQIRCQIQCQILQTFNAKSECWNHPFLGNWLSLYFGPLSAKWQQIQLKGRAHQRVECQEPGQVGLYELPTTISKSTQMYIFVFHNVMKHRTWFDPTAQQPHLSLIWHKTTKSWSFWPVALPFKWNCCKIYAKQIYVKLSCKENPYPSLISLFF